MDPPTENWRLVKMSADDFGDEPAHRHWYNRDVLFIAAIALAVAAMAVYHFVFATR
jgi:hypothetical protein